MSDDKPVNLTSYINKTPASGGQMLTFAYLDALIGELPSEPMLIMSVSMRDRIKKLLYDVRSQRRTHKRYFSRLTQKQFKRRICK